METPVVIPVHEEAANPAARFNLQHTLRALPRGVMPILGLNGPNLNNALRTAKEAAEQGAIYHVIDEPGKLEAIQFLLDAESDKLFGTPFLCLDAGAEPDDGPAWLESMVYNLEHPANKHADPTKSRANGGPVRYVKRWPMNVLKTKYRLRNAQEQQDKGITHDTLYTPEGESLQYGQQMGFYIIDSTTYEELQFRIPPKTWPAEDRAMAAVVLDNGGTFEQVTNQEAMVVTELSPNYPSRLRFIAMGAVALANNMTSPQNAKSQLALNLQSYVHTSYERNALPGMKPFKELPPKSSWVQIG